MKPQREKTKRKKPKAEASMTVGDIYGEIVANKTNDLMSSLVYVPEFNLEMLEVLADMVSKNKSAHRKKQSEQLVKEAISRHIANHRIPKKDQARFFDMMPWTLKRCWGILQPFSAVVQRSLVKFATEQTQKLVTARRDIQKHAKRVATIYNGLDLKTKLLFAVASSLNNLSGVNIDCFSDVFEKIEDRAIQNIVKGKKDRVLSKDSDIAFLSDLYSCAEYIQNAT